MGRGRAAILRPRSREAPNLTAPATRLARGDLLAVVASALGASRGGERSLRIGLEAELIPVDRDGRRVPPEAAVEGGAATLPLVKTVAERFGGTLDRGPTGSPRARLPGHGVVTFEPGGQVEFASDPFTSVDAVLLAARSVLTPLFEAAEASGVTLLTRGMDPRRDASAVPLAVGSERYRKQRAHYDRIGPWGADMMIRSAGLHLNLDLGGRPVRRWWLANRLAPFLTAMFANSPGRDAERAYRSERAEQWRHLDPSRTGVFPQDNDSPGAYLKFALGATDFLGAPEGEPPRPFRAAWEQGADLERWRRHLTTLFPEVRPRGYLELRSVDAVRPAWYAVPLVVATALLYGQDALSRAEEALPPADPELLLRAGREGVRDAAIRDVCAEILELSLRGARALGQDVIGGEAVECVEEFARRFTGRGRDPGDEPDGSPPFEP